MKTEAAILVDTGKPLVVDEVDTPQLKPGQVLVEVLYSGACHTQVMEARGRKGPDKWIPHCLGHEGVGVVREIGEAVTRVKPDDKVVLSWIRANGIDAGGTGYDWNGTRVNAGGVTTFQKHSVASENRLTPMPDSLTPEQGILLGCAAPTGMGALVNTAGLRLGDAVAVFGVGGVGLNTCMAAAFGGAHPVIGVDPNPARRELATLFGATHTVDPSAGDPVEQIREIVPGGVDIAIEATGLPEVMAQATQSTRMRGGRAVVIGNARHGHALEIDPSTFNAGKSLMGTFGGDADPERDYPRFTKVLGSGRFRISDLISAPYPLAQIDQALQDLEAGKVGRPLIDMSL
jgi:S-(hydroxymethyl)glutathione dehydrogenase/alcohol dehydrogenase